MAESKKKEMDYGGMLRSAVLAWLLSAALCLLLSALLLEKGLLPFRAVGYLSSALSFLTALMAGRTMAKRGNGSFFAALSVSVCLVILLLTLGFLVSSGGLAPAGILSVSTFTIAGFLFGNLLLRRKSPRPKSSLYPIKRK